jgi:hypothetical protein
MNNTSAGGVPSLIHTLTGEHASRAGGFTALRQMGTGAGASVQVRVCVCACVCAR